VFVPRGYTSFQFFRKNATIVHGVQSEVLFNTDGCTGTTEEIKFLEHVEIVTNIAYTMRGALEMHLTSPAGQWSREISGSHGGEYEDDCLLGCFAVQSNRNWPTASIIIN
jgi:hypothetical protein